MQKGYMLTVEGHNGSSLASTTTGSKRHPRIDDQTWEPLKNHIEFQNAINTPILEMFRDLTGHLEFLFLQRLGFHRDLP
jgi:hypothetical protein